MFINLGSYNKGVPTAGIHLLLTFKRRITNAILTIYLPTFLLLCIVYATNFFKDFFFEAVVTVNLTALLVLTTLFISVSGSLPTTSYVKMVDVWLIFALMIPFIEVLLATWMDTCRVDADREINHHGTAIEVGNSVDQEKLQEKVHLIERITEKMHNCFLNQDLIKI